MISKKKTLTMIVVATLMLAAMPMFANPVNAPAIPTPPIVEWLPGGIAVHDTLMWNPEWLKVWTKNHVSHDTTIHVLGKDTYGKDVEATAFIPASTPPQRPFVLVDPHSLQPVTFARITFVYQQGGEHCNSFEIQTFPAKDLNVPEDEDWLGTYEYPNYRPQIDPAGFPVEPRNPEPIKVVVNWVDIDGDNLPDLANPNEFNNIPVVDSQITIIGMDEQGNKLEVIVNIPAGSKIVLVGMIPLHTWSTVCKVEALPSTSGITYDIFTEPAPQRQIIVYRIRVANIKVEANPVNILADGISTSTITITLVDIDGHEVHWTTPTPDIFTGPVEINVASSGGRVTPSLGIQIPGCNTHATTILTSDTNARIVKVSVLALCPMVKDIASNIIHDKMQLTSSIELCFDGINSVPYSKKYEIIKLKREVETCTGRYAVFIRLEGGLHGKCNLISIPVIPEEPLTWNIIPCASECLLSVSTYQGGIWLYYDFRTGIGDIIPIRDGWAYWVKAEKDCTLVISGRHLDQYDPVTGFGTPPMYPMALGWNFVGVTTTKNAIKTADYFESLKDMGLGEKLWGPVWVYRNGNWIRNPPWLRAGEGVWLFTYTGILAP